MSVDGFTCPNCRKTEVRNIKDGLLQCVDCQYEFTRLEGSLAAEFPALASVTGFLQAKAKNVISTEKDRKSSHELLKELRILVEKTRNSGIRAA